MARTKRRFRGQDGGDERQEQHIKLHSMPKSEKPAAVKFRALACPFFKKDPRRHWDCASSKSKDAKVSQVKQHIYRKHTRPHICPFCRQEFKDPQLRDNHLRVGCPQPRPFLEPDGITMDQRNALNKRTASKLNVESQWYAMFDIIFPGNTRPASPYNRPEVSRCEGTHAKLKELIESDQVVETLFRGVFKSLGKDLIPGTTAYLRAAVRKGLQDLIELHRRAISGSMLDISLQTDDGESPTSIDSINPSPSPSPSASFKADIQPSDASQLSGGGMGNIINDLPSISLLSESWPVFPDLDGGHIHSTASMRFIQKNSLDEIQASTAKSLAGLDHDVNRSLQRDLTSGSVTPGHSAGFLVPHQGSQATHVAPDLFTTLWMNGPQANK